MVLTPQGSAKKDSIDNEQTHCRNYNTDCALLTKVNQTMQKVPKSSKSILPEMYKSISPKPRYSSTTLHKLFGNVKIKRR